METNRDLDERHLQPYEDQKPEQSCMQTQRGELEDGIQMERARERGRCRESQMNI